MKMSSKCSEIDEEPYVRQRPLEIVLPKMNDLCGQIFTLNAKHQSYNFFIFFQPIFAKESRLNRYNLFKLIGHLGPIDVWSLFESFIEPFMVPGDFEMLC